MIRDMIVLNSVNKKVQERLLETDDLDLLPHRITALDYRWFEMTSRQVPAMNFTGNSTRWKELIVAEERESRQHAKATQRHL